MVRPELDLSYFQRQTVETPVASVVRQLHANPQLRQIFSLHGDVTFENHANTLTDEQSIEEDMDSLSLNHTEPRRSSRLAAKLGPVGLSSAASAAQPTRRDRNAPRPRRSRPRADQFCVYNKGPERKVPALIIEYKAPHKLSLAHIKAGLQDMDLDEVVRVQKEESPEVLCRRVVAAVITQTFSYMINAGLEYGYVCTGEAFIFLRVLHDNPTTVYYYLLVPGEDVGASTGWTADANSDNRLHLTSMGQVLAFTLRALRVPTRDIGWTTWAERSLLTWVVIFDDLLEGISEIDIPSSNFKSPARSRNAYCRMSPVKTRSKSAGVSLCAPSSHESGPSDQDDNQDTGDGFDPNTPSRRPREAPSSHPSTSSHSSAVEKSQSSRSKGKPREYCTQRCLQGLVKGGKLDRQCPNVQAHGHDRHRLNPTALIRRLDQQFSNNDLQMGCESLHIHGTRGALFKITLWSHGYTFVAKGTPVEFVEGSQYEELVYSHLTSIQGKNVPVLIGSLDLRYPFSYDGIAEIVHLMFLGFAGRTLAKQHDLDRGRLAQEAENSLQAIHDLGVLHGDPIPGNIIWNAENESVMLIDFERAKFQSRRTPLGGISPNEIGNSSEKPGSYKRPDCFTREKRRMRNAL